VAVFVRHRADSDSFARATPQERATLSDDEWNRLDTLTTQLGQFHLGVLDPAFRLRVQADLTQNVPDLDARRSLDALARTLISHLRYNER